jgi:hypothetical protein
METGPACQGAGHGRRRTSCPVKTTMQPRPPAGPKAGGGAAGGGVAAALEDVQKVWTRTEARQLRLGNDGHTTATRTVSQQTGLRDGLTEVMDGLGNGLT